MPHGKKKKGRAPAHQNTHAFTHNPKSKKTETILNSPNTHVCRRCHEKIEWRKRYRKYKPRTQPGTCNFCTRRNVMAAYHTICTSCTTSDKAMNGLVQQQKQQESSSIAAADGVEVTSDSTCNVEENAHESGHDEAVQEVSQAASELTIEDADSQPASTKNKNKKPCHRVCAMCTKEPALPDENDGESTGIDDLVGNRKLKLRERRALERKLAKEQESAKKKEKPSDDNEEENGMTEQEHDTNDDVSDDEANDEEEGSDIEDDFIKAVGGEDKLLTGEAYQKMLLEREKEGVSTS